MGLEVVHAFKAGIDETEGRHSGQRCGRAVEHREFVDEIAVGVVVLDSSRIALVGQDFLVEPNLITEKGELLFFGFKISEALITENEVHRDEPGSYVFGRMGTPKADIFSANRFVDIAREEMKNAAMSEVFLCAGMLLLHDLSSKGDTALACLGLNELQELPAGEIPGMRSHKVKKLSFLFRIAEIPECFRMNG